MSLMIERSWQLFAHFRPGATSARVCPDLVMWTGPGMLHVAPALRQCRADIPLSVNTCSLCRFG